MPQSVRYIRLNDTGVFYLTLIIISSFYRAQQWSESMGVPDTEQNARARTLSNRVIRSHHFSETHFKTKEKKGLNWLAVPSLRGSIPSIHSTPQPNYPSPPQSSYPTSLSENEPIQLSPAKNSNSYNSQKPIKEIP